MPPSTCNHCGAALLNIVGPGEPGKRIEACVCPVCDADEAQRIFEEIEALAAKPVLPSDPCPKCGLAQVTLQGGTRHGLLICIDCDKAEWDAHMNEGAKSVAVTSAFEQPVLESQSTAVRLIAIGELHESPWNPRQVYPAAALSELTESMKASGFRPWLPIVARPRLQAELLDGYEVAAGHRRLRAAKEAGLIEVPVLVREMSDAEFLDVLNFDNSGREDVHPLHEAAGWRAWMEKTGGTVLDIAARIGQSREYVYGRMKYADLIEPARIAFLEGRISARNAERIARRIPRYQEAALEYLLPSFDPGRHVTTRELDEWLKRKCDLSLEKASFNPNDETLLPIVGSCTACPKRSGASPEIFSDIEDPQICTDASCYGAKQQAAAARIPEAEPEPVPEVQVIPPVVEPEPEPAKSTPKRKAGPTADELAQKQQAFEWEERAREEREKAERPVRIAAERRKRVYAKSVEAICAKLKWPPPPEAMREICTIAVESLDGCEEAAEMFAIPRVHGTVSRLGDLFQAVQRMEPEKLLRVTVAAILFDSGADMGWSDTTAMISLAGACKVDRVKIAQAVDAEMNPKPAAPKPADARKAPIGKLPTLADKGAKKAAGKKAPAAPVKKAAAKVPAKKAAKAKGGKK